METIICSCHRIEDLERKGEEHECKCNDVVCNIWSGADRGAGVPGIDYCAGDQRAPGT